MDDTDRHKNIGENNNDFKRFIVSIVLSCIGVFFLILLISFIPIIKEVFWNNELQPLDYKNFFYKWSYSQWTDVYNLQSFRPSTGYYLFSPEVYE
ncbi:MAG: hypothetical protein HGN29_17805 [Asgard group archaeon]|nr:hypothetical protein [Asgard group archaeon]